MNKELDLEKFKEEFKDKIISQDENIIIFSFDDNQNGYLVKDVNEIYHYFKLDSSITINGTFHEGKAQVKKDNKIGYIDINGNMITKIEYDQGRNYHENRVIVYKNNLAYILNENGNILNINKVINIAQSDSTQSITKSIIANDITDYHDGYAILTGLGKKCLVNKDGYCLIENNAMFDNITKFGKVYYVKTNDEYKCILPDDKSIISDKQMKIIGDYIFIYDNISKERSSLLGYANIKRGYLIHKNGYVSNCIDVYKNIIINNNIITYCTPYSGLFFSGYYVINGYIGYKKLEKEKKERKSTSYYFHSIGHKIYSTEEDYNIISADINNEFIIVKKRGKYTFFKEDFLPLFNGYEFERIVNYNNSKFYAIANNECYLINKKNYTMTKTNFIVTDTYFKKNNKTYLVAYNTNNLFGLIDEEGNIVYPFIYKTEYEVTDKFSLAYSQERKIKLNSSKISVHIENKNDEADFDFESKVEKITSIKKKKTTEEEIIDKIKNYLNLFNIEKLNNEFNALLDEYNSQNENAIKLEIEKRKNENTENKFTSLTLKKEQSLDDLKLNFKLKLNDFLLKLEIIKKYYNIYSYIEKCLSIFEKDFDKNDSFLNDFNDIIQVYYKLDDVIREKRYNEIKNDLLNEKEKYKEALEGKSNPEISNLDEWKMNYRLLFNKYLIQILEDNDLNFIKKAIDNKKDEINNINKNTYYYLYKDCKRINKLVLYLTKLVNEYKDFLGEDYSNELLETIKQYSNITISLDKSAKENGVYTYSKLKELIKIQTDIEYILEPTNYMVNVDSQQL